MTTKQYLSLIAACGVASFLTSLMASVYPGLAIFAWTPVWAAYALWQNLLRRQATKLPPANEFEREFRDLLEKEGKK